MLLQRPQAFGLAARGRPAPPQLGHTPLSRSRVRAAAGPEGGKPIREFREDSGEIVVGGEQKKVDNAIYADQVAQARPKNQDNMSKEMKQRLRQEYYGLGGAENTATSRPGGRGGMFVVAAATVEAEPAQAEAPQQQQRHQQQAELSAAAPAQQPSSSGSKWVIDESEVLHSTWEHRGWTYGCLAVLGASLAGVAARVHGVHDAGVVGGALLAAYVLSDLGTAVFHWGVDNYGDADTPVLGRQIAAFQGHHQRPWTITQREFANNVHQVFKPALTPAAVLLVACPWLPLGWAAFLPTFTLLCCMSQQFHAWSHMKPSELHPAVIALQDAGLLIGRKAHGAHHRPNFEGNYSIVSGWWNPLLDGSGFFRALEKGVAAVAGVEPRCWYEPQYGWQEETQPGQPQQPQAAKP